MQTHSIRGVIAMLAAVACFSVMDVIMKRLVETYPAMQVTFLRGAASLPFLLAASALFNNWRRLAPVRWKLHLLRGFLSVVTLCSFIYAVSILSLADAYAIFMSAPLLITALSVVLLGDKVEWQRWIAVFVGLTGVMVVLQPTGAGVLTLGGVAALAAASGYALSAVTIRMLARTDSRAATMLWALLLMTIFSGVLAIPAWTPLRSTDWWWIAGLGLSGALGQYFVTDAFHCARPAVIAPLEFTALAWGLMFDWAIWSTTPNTRMLVGASIIVASGLYVIRRETTEAKTNSIDEKTSQPKPTSAPS